jgi:hypothetical protein
MAAPNLTQPSLINGKSAFYSCTTSLAPALSNAAASGKLLKVNTVRAANITNSAAAIETTIYRGSTHQYLLKGANVAPQSALLISDRNEYIYLEEGDSLYAKASAATAIDLTIHYEEIS